MIQLLLTTGCLTLFPYSLLLRRYYSNLTAIWHPPRPPLTFTQQGTFQISIFADLHFGESMSTHSPCAVSD